MSTPVWSAGTLYNPGAIVTPRTAPPVGTDPPTNANFESGDSGWDKGTGWSITNADGSFDGTYAAVYPSATGANAIINQLEVPVTPGLVINAQCMANTTGNSVSQGGAAVRVYWYDATHTLITASEGNIVRGGGSAWYASGVTATAPSGAAFAKIGANAFRNSGPHNILLDTFTWDYAFTTPPAGLVFKAVQADAAFSASTEPVWPTVLGNTVVDGGVTWEAVVATQVTYTTQAILKSGSSEPTWPTTIGGSVADGSIIWQAVSGVITDSKCPNSAVVAIAASKVFGADRDIIPFCATVNPLDWSTANDAGYLPFGLQTYGSQSVAALGLYRGNLVAFNATGFQMWQVDQDPTNMALLDAVPVSCTFPKTVQPIANDLIFLNAKGLRNISIAGASTNLQANGVGQPIDTLVQPLVKEGSFTPIGLYWPFMGQYWLIFGTEAFVLTINGANARSWSRYTFPDPITDWTLDGDSLVLRMGDTILRMDPDLTQDDVYSPPNEVILSGSLTGGNQSVLLTWTSAGGTFPVTYTIYRSVNGGSFSQLTQTTALTYTNTTPGAAAYQYYVIASNDQGDSTEASNTVSETIAGGPVTYVPSSHESFSPTGANTMTFTLTSANVNPTTFASAVIILTMDLYKTSSLPSAEPTVDIDGTACAVTYTTGSTAGGDAGSRLRQAVAMVRIPPGGFSIGLVTINWTNAVSATVFCTASAFYNVNTLSDGFGGSTGVPFSGTVNNAGLPSVNTAVLDAPANGAILVDGCAYVLDSGAPNLISSTVDSTAYTALTPDSGHLSSVAVTSMFPRSLLSYRLFTPALASEQTHNANGQSFRIFTVVSLAGT